MQSGTHTALLTEVMGRLGVNLPLWLGVRLQLLFSVSVVTHMLWSPTMLQYLQSTWHARIDLRDDRLRNENEQLVFNCSNA